MFQKTHKYFSDKPRNRSVKHLICATTLIATLLSGCKDQKLIDENKNLISENSNLKSEIAESKSLNKKQSDIIENLKKEISDRKVRAEDQAAIDLAEIKAESALSECNLEKAIESYRVALVHNRENQVLKQKLDRLNEAVNCIQNEKFESFFKVVDAITKNNPRYSRLAKISRDALELSNRHFKTILSLNLIVGSQSNFVEENNNDRKIIAALLTLERNNDFDFEEKIYNEIYSTLNTKSVKDEKDPSSFVFLFNIKDKWKRIMAIVDNKFIRNKLEDYNIPVKDASANWLPTTTVLKFINDKVKSNEWSQQDDEQFPSLKSGWSIGELLLEHASAYNQLDKKQ